MTYDTLSADVVTWVKDAGLGHLLGNRGRGTNNHVNRLRGAVLDYHLITRTDLLKLCTSRGLTIYGSKAALVT